MGPRPIYWATPVLVKASSGLTENMYAVVMKYLSSLCNLNCDELRNLTFVRLGHSERETPLVKLGCCQVEEQDQDLGTDMD